MRRYTLDISDREFVIDVQELSADQFEVVVGPFEDRARDVAAKRPGMVIAAPHSGPINLKSVQRPLS